MENNELKQQLEAMIGNIQVFHRNAVLDLMQKVYDMPRWIACYERTPDYGEKVLGALQHWETKNYRYYELKRVDESDCSWRTCDDNSEVSYDWTVTHYQPLPPNPAQDERK